MNKIQERIFSIFQEVAKICEDNNIPYFATEGTCLGAVRHKGFIPWDDDLDIAIPIEHYYRFAELAKKMLPDNMYLFTPDKIHHYFYMWYKVCDRNTAFIETSEYGFRDAYKGVFIDITPISGLPEDKKELDKYIKKLRTLQFLNSTRRFPLSSINGLKRIVLKLVLSFLPVNFFSKLYLKELGKYPYENSKLTGHTWHAEDLVRFNFPTSCFEKGEKLDFEGVQINCPKNYHQYLTLRYGDYMQLPPENQRISHNGFVDLEHSFLKYKKEGLTINK